MCVKCLLWKLNFQFVHFMAECFLPLSHISLSLSLCCCRYCYCCCTKTTNKNMRQYKTTLTKTAQCRLSRGKGRRHWWKWRQPQCQHISHKYKYLLMPHAGDTTESSAGRLRLWILRVEARNGRRQTQTEIEAEKAAMLAALLTHFP